MNQTNKITNGIPLIEYTPDFATLKGVFFIIHGHTCTKDPMYFGSFPKRLTDLGYLVIAIDAYKHGDRIEEPYLSGKDDEKTIAMLDVIQKTCEDILFLYENIYQKIGGKLGFLGISMGGHVVFQMPKYIQKIDLLIPLIGSPDLKRHYIEMKSQIIGQERMENLNSIFANLSMNDEMFNQDSQMLIVEGKNDTIVSYLNAFDFYKRMRNKGYHHIEYFDFPVGHEITKEMENHVMDYIAKYTTQS